MPENTIYDQESENCIIGRVLSGEGKEYDDVMKSLYRLDPEDFYQPHCREAMRIFLELLESNETPSLSSVYRHIMQNKDKYKYLKLSTLDQSSAAFSQVNNKDAAFHIDQILYWSHHRNLADLVQQMGRSVGTSDFMRLTAEFASKAQGYTAKTNLAKLPHENRDLHTQRVFGLIEDEENPKYGIPSLDEITDGMIRNTLGIVAGRPGTGKSAFAIQMMVEGMKQGFSVLYLSHEMTESVINTRLKAYITGIDSRLINGIGGKQKAAKLTEAQKDAIVNADRFLHSKKYVITEVTEMNLNHLQPLVNEASKILGKNIDILIIDYLQLVAENSRERDVRRKITETITILRRIAKQNNLHVMALAQVNRDSEKADSKPKAADLKDSGDIEQAADYINLIHRKPGAKTGEFLFVKNRHGQALIKGIEFEYIAQTGEFMEIEK